MFYQLCKKELKETLYHHLGVMFLILFIFIANHLPLPWNITEPNELLKADLINHSGVLGMTLTIFAICLGTFAFYNDWKGDTLYFLFTRPISKYMLTLYKYIIHLFILFVYLGIYAAYLLCSHPGMIKYSFLLISLYGSILGFHIAFFDCFLEASKFLKKPSNFEKATRLFFCPVILFISVIAMLDLPAFALMFPELKKNLNIILPVLVFTVLIIFHISIYKKCNHA
ncbi:hypothetical protein ACFL35_04685 [Candidatus Riflebacteria bacterium]